MKACSLFILAFLFCHQLTAQKLTKEQYLDTGRYIWQTYLPKSGQAKTVQGELLRAIEKLADEAQRNGNINFNPKCHGLLITYLHRYLTDEKIFDKATIQQIRKDLDRLSDGNNPYTEDDLYDRLRERVIDWYMHNRTPVAHKENKQLYC